MLHGARDGEGLHSAVASAEQGFGTDPHVRPLIFDVGDKRSLYFNFDGLQSSMKRGEPSVLEVDYTKTMMGFLLVNAQPQDILMIGLGGGSLPKFCYHNLAARITVVEVNPHIIAVRDDFEVPPDNERFHVVQADGAEWTRHASAAFDVLIVDGFDHVGQPPQLCSVAFYADCYRALKPNGLMVVNLHLESGFADALENIQEAFAGCAETVDAVEGGNGIVFACKGASWSTRAMSLSWALQNLRPEGREQLLPELQRVLRAFETAEGQRLPRRSASIP